MRRHLRSNNSTIIKLAMLGVVAMAAGFLLTSLLGSKGKTQALSATEFQPGRIIDDSIFYNPNTMTAAEIDAFIDSHNPACDMWGTQKVYGNVTRAEYVKQLRAGGNTKFHDPPFVCISEYYENPETHKTNFSTGGKKEEGMLSAGEIIYQAAHEYNVNPQVLLVMLKKESYVWGDDWPHSFQYNTVMGYACPDGAPCDTKYFGFYNQVMMAAWQLNYYRENIYSYNYRPYATNNILYNPDRSCGSKAVYLENIATTSLYIYTPYVPNDAALANYPGTSYCGSYGNRNFYMYFREWFGSTLGTPKEEAFFPDGDYYIVPAQSPNEALQPTNGSSENGAKYTLKQRNINNSSIFKLERQSDGNYAFINAANGLALDVYGGALSAGSTISQWETHKGTSQRFKIIDNKDGTYSLSVFNNTNVVITYSDEDDSLSLDWSTGTDSQAFRLISTRISSLEGTHRIVSASNRNFAADIYGGAIRKDGANINTWEQNPSDGQSFSFTFDPTTSYYRIQPSYSSEYSIDVIGGGKKTNTNIGLWSNNDGCAQKWEPRFYENSEEISLINACSGLTFDLHGGVAQNGANISTWSYDGNTAQRWILLDPISKRTDNPYPGIYEATARSKKIKFLSDLISRIEISQHPVSGLYSIRLNTDKYLAATRSGTTSLTSTANSNYYESLWDISGNFNNLTIRNASNGLYLAVKDDGTLSLEDSPSYATVFEFKAVSPSTYGYSEDGYYTIQSVLNDNYYLGILNNTGRKGDNVNLVDKKKALKVYISKTSDGAFTIEDESRTRVLDMEGGISYNGANVGAWDNNGNHCNQKWIISQSADNTAKIFESCKGRALEIYGGITANGTNIGIWDSHTGANQSWIIKKVNP